MKLSFVIVCMLGARTARADVYYDFETAATSPVWFGTTGLIQNTSASHQGTNAIAFLPVAGGAVLTELPSGTTNLEFYIYDDYGPNPPLYRYMFLRLLETTNSAAFAGFTMLDAGWGTTPPMTKDHYYAWADYDWYSGPYSPNNMGPIRTVGWHRFTFAVGAESVTMSVDGVSVLQTNIIRTARFLAVSFGQEGGWGRMDDFSVSTGALGPVLSIRVSQVELCWVSRSGNAYQVQYRSQFTADQWLNLGDPFPGADSVTCTNDAVSGPQRFYRVVALSTNSPASTNTPLPANMALIPAGSFTMGDTFSEGDSSELPSHANYVSAFYMDQYLVTKGAWDDVYTWATSHGYTFDYGANGKQTSHPAQFVTWYDAVKWCNARSEMGCLIPCYYTGPSQTTVYRNGDIDLANTYVNWGANGYRLPTEAEWEKAARGGASGNRFPWSDADTIDGSRANYWAANCSTFGYDLSCPAGFNPAYAVAGQPYTSPVGSLAPNGYGLYDMAGNVQEWCWDWYGAYSSSPGTDPRGPVAGFYRILRGGSWSGYAGYCRVASRFRAYGPSIRTTDVGFRCVVARGQ